MSHDELRSKWRSSRTIADHAALLREAVSAGLLEEERLRYAAALGHPAALASGVQPERLVGSYRGRTWQALGALPDRSVVRFAVAVAARTSDISMTVLDQHNSPDRFLALASEWCDSSAADIARIEEADERLGRILSAAGQKLTGDDSSDPVLGAALHAGAAIAEVVGALLCAVQHPPSEKRRAEIIEDPRYAASHAAQYASYAARDYCAEVRWQSQHLSELLVDHEND